MTPMTPMSPFLNITYVEGFLGVFSVSEGQVLVRANGFQPME